MFNLHNPLPGTQLFLSRLGLQTRFLLIFGVSALFFALAVWFVFNNVAERMIERIGARVAGEQALYDRTHILQPLIREVALAREMADNAIIKRWAENEQNPQLRRQAQAELEKYRRHSQGGNYFLALTGSGHYYYDDTGGQFPDNAQPRFTLDPTRPADSWFYATTGDIGDYNINVGTNPNLGLTKIWINVLLRDGNKVLGVLGTGLDADIFSRHAGDAEQSGTTNLLVDRNAVIQIFRHTGSIDFSGIAKSADQKYSTDQLLDNPEDRAWVKQAIGETESGGSPATARSVYLKGQLYSGNSRAATNFVQIKGKPYLASITALPETGWYDVTLLDLSVLLPQHDFLEVILAIGGVSLALMIILLFSLRRLVLRPVAVLTAASERIRRGDYASAPAEKGGGEIGQLAAQFQAMRHAVYKSHSWMEEEINKRTKQLSDAKEMLEVSLQQEKNSRENQANLLSLMAHEIRSPIAVIGNTSQMLNALAQTQQPDWQPRIEKIMGAVLQLALLMNKFLDEERINTKDNELDLKMGDLNVFCGEIADTLAANHERSIRYVPYDGDAMILADWHLVSIAIGNLIDNAIKYSPSDSEIGLSIIQNKAGMLCVEVTDQGPGITLELQQRIFNEKFIRGEHGSKIRGTGLGLYLINWIAISHGGYAEVFSTPGNGSTFRLYLPMRKQV